MEVAGARRLDEGVVRAAAGIEPGTNLFAIDVAATEARVASLPGVRRAHVARHLPGRVTVLVEEREPHALVNGRPTAPPDRRRGVPRHLDARPGATGLPILTGVDAPLPARPRLPRACGPVWRCSMSCSAPPDAWPRASPRWTWGRPNGPVLYLVDGIEVRLGIDAWGDRLARLDGVLAELDAGRAMASIDLRFRDQVVLTPRILTTSTARPCLGRLVDAGCRGARHLGVPAMAGLERR